ncbi:MAG: flagellar motor switch protein FliG [Bryobacteraceae bacterium]
MATGTATLANPPALPTLAPPQEANAAVQPLRGARKAAILLTLVGDEAGAEILRQLSEEDAHEVAREVSLLENISDMERRHVIDDFVRISQNIDLYRTGGLEYAKTVIYGAFGPETGKRMIERLVKSIGTSMPGIEALQKADPEHMAKIIHREHPQTIALILCHLTTSQAARLLAALPAELRAPVIRRMASLEQISPEVIDRLAKSICAKLRIAGESSLESCGGVRAVAQVLNHVDAGASKEVLEQIASDDPGLGQNIRQLMFVFADLQNVAAESLKMLLARTDRKVLTLALKGAEPQLKKHVMSLMSNRAAEMLEEDLAALGPVRIRDVRDAQQQVMTLAAQLQAEGVISLQPDSNDQYVV